MACACNQRTLLLFEMNEQKLRKVIKHLFNNCYQYLIHSVLLAMPLLSGKTGKILITFILLSYLSFLILFTTD